jgi:hypothetical protein
MPPSPTAFRGRSARDAGAHVDCAVRPRRDGRGVPEESALVTALFLP